MIVEEEELPSDTIMVGTIDYFIHSSHPPLGKKEAKLDSLILVGYMLCVGRRG